MKDKFTLEIHGGKRGNILSINYEREREREREKEQATNQDKKAQKIMSHGLASLVLFMRY